MNPAPPVTKTLLMEMANYHRLDKSFVFTNIPAEDG
jgi:hypothetical protein